MQRLISRITLALLLAVPVLLGERMVPSAKAALPDFNRLRILDVSHAVEEEAVQGPDIFYPEGLSLSYRLLVRVRIERPLGWDSSLFILPEAVTSYLGKAIIGLYEEEGRQREDLVSLKVRCEIHPLWVSGEEELPESPSRISYYVPTFLLERGRRGQISPTQMLERGRAHFRALWRRQRGSR
jgi:hypothetical protein